MAILYEIIVMVKRTDWSAAFIPEVDVSSLHHAGMTAFKVLVST